MPFSIIEDLVCATAEISEKEPVESKYLSKIVPLDNCYHVGVIHDLLDLKNGPWIAGGAVLSWFNQTAVRTGDIDIFFSDPMQVDVLVERLKSSGFHDRYPCKTSKNFVSSQGRFPDLKIQLVTSHYYSSVDELLDRFDLTICKVATDGHRFHVSDHRFFLHNNKKILHFDKISDQSLKRLAKYTCMGYTSPNEQTRQIINMFDFSKQYTQSNYSEDGYLHVI